MLLRYTIIYCILVYSTDASRDGALSRIGDSSSRKHLNRALLVLYVSRRCGKRAPVRFARSSVSARRAIHTMIIMV